MSLSNQLIFGQAKINNSTSQVWVSDNGDGTYKNPVLHADYSDPDVVRVGDDYYMTSSSFNCIPGLPILHSKDMVNWELVNYALPKQPPFDVFDKPQHGNGVWAPCIRYHNNELYIYYPDPDYGIYMIKTKDPKGVWSKPILIKEGKGLIDPTPLWDDDGKAYLAFAFAGSRAGIKSLLAICTLNAQGTIANDDDVIIIDGHDGEATIEGPKLYKHNGYYYIFAPAGGVATGWQTVLRAKNIFGPYEKRKVMDQGKTNINGPHQGAWVQTKTGEDWFFHFQDKGAYGRIVHLEPMKWVNNWPVIGSDQDRDGIGEPVAIHKKPNVGKTYPVATPNDSDEFNTSKLGLQWQWHANQQVYWGFP
ncbi:MAG TPA: family 43 glycosylhydrolase, partial [Flavobacterium sp.]